MWFISFSSLLIILPPLPSLLVLLHRLLELNIHRCFLLKFYFFPNQQEKVSFSYRAMLHGSSSTSFSVIIVHFIIMSLSILATSRRTTTAAFGLVRSTVSLSCTNHRLAGRVGIGGRGAPGGGLGSSKLVFPLGTYRYYHQSPLLSNANSFLLVQTMKRSSTETTSSIICFSTVPGGGISDHSAMSQSRPPFAMPKNSPDDSQQGQVNDKKDDAIKGKTATTTSSTSSSSSSTWNRLGLYTEIINCLEGEMQLVAPTKIQSMVIPHLLQSTRRTNTNNLQQQYRQVDWQYVVVVYPWRSPRLALAN